MTVKWQHYVPQTYLKAWETRVTSKKEPRKWFDGIYFYEKWDLETGDGRNKDSVLCESRLYTVDYDLSFIIPSCPEIEKDYISQVKAKLDERQANAYFEGRLLETEEDLTRNFLKVDEWEFRQRENPENLAKRKAILSDIKQINSYVIENALDDVVEKKWQDFLNKFIKEMETTVPLNGVDEIRQINEDTVLDIVKMVIYLICRNPEFNCLGIFPMLRDIVFEGLPEGIDEESQKAREDFINKQMDAVWLMEIYKGLFNVPSGYFHYLKEIAQSSFQIILYKCHEGQGSFITSDTAAFEHISLVEATNMNSIICPLTPDYLIMIMKGDRNSLRNVNFRLANNALIRKFNSIILNHSQKAIVSNYKHLGFIL